MNIWQASLQVHHSCGHEKRFARVGSFGPTAQGILWKYGRPEDFAGHPLDARAPEVITRFPGFAKIHVHYIKYLLIALRFRATF